VGWHATYHALVRGEGPYGTVRESLQGESDPGRTLQVALSQINLLRPELDRPAKARLAYWRRRAGWPND